MTGKFAILFALITACEPEPYRIVYECFDQHKEEAQAKADFMVKCIESGGRGVRSTEDWVAACRDAAPSYCTKELGVQMNEAGGWAHIPCRVAGPTTGLAMCRSAGYQATETPK